MLIRLEELKLHRILFSKTYPEGEVDYHTSDFQQAGDLKVEGVAALAGAEIHLRGGIATRVVTTCDRCLDTVEMPVETDFDLFYRPESTIAREEEVEISPAELDVGFYTGDGINLADVVTEQVTLFMPMKVVCRAECKGLCAVCKKNLNRGECQCAPQLLHNSPFASLLGE